MTRIFKSLFLSGILLSSVSGYSSQLSIVSGSGIPASSTHAISINGATVTVQESLELNTNITVGDLRDGLAYSAEKIIITKPGESAKEYSAGDVIVANGFKYATSKGGEWKELYVDSPSQIVPISSSTYMYGMADTNKIYAHDDTSFTTPLFESEDNGVTWHVSNDTTKTVKVVNIDGTQYKISGGNVLYSGNVAVKDTDNVWKLLPGFSPNLAKAVLTVNGGEVLTLGNQQEQEQDEFGNPVYEGDCTTPKMVNKESSILIVTELGEVYGNVDLQNTKIDGETVTYANKAVFKKDSKAGDSEAKATLSKGVVDLSDHLSVSSGDGTPIFTPNSSLNLNLDFSEIKMFPSSNVDTDDTSAIISANSMFNFIDKFNSNTTQLFPNVTGNISVNYVPYLCVATSGDETNYLHKSQIDATLLSGISKDTTLSFKSVGLDKIKSHFASDAKVSFAGVNVQNVADNFIKGLKTLNDSTTGSGDITLTLDVYSLQQVYGNSTEEGITLSSLESGYDGTDKKFKIVLKTTNEQSEDTPLQPVETVTPEAELDEDTGIATTTIGSGDAANPTVANVDLPEPPEGATEINYDVKAMGTKAQPSEVKMPEESSTGVEKNMEMKDSYANLVCSDNPEKPSILNELALDGCKTTLTGAMQVNKIAFTNSDLKVLGSFTIGKPAQEAKIEVESGGGE